MIDKSAAFIAFIWTPSICECKCDRSCDVKKYLGYTNYKCRKRLIDKLVEKFDEDNDANKMIHHVTLHDYGKVCKSCMLYVALLIIAFIIIIVISDACIYFYWNMIKKCFNKLSF